MENLATSPVPTMPDDEAFRSIAARVDLALALLEELSRALPDPGASNADAALHVCRKRAAKHTDARESPRMPGPDCVLVPKVPTLKMLQAGHGATKDGVRGVWTAMLQAAPSQNLK